MGIHIPIGRRVRGIIEGHIGHAVSIAGVVAGLILFALTLHSCVPDADAQELPKVIPYGQTHDGRVATDVYFFALPNASASATIHTQSCISPDVIVDPGRGAVLRDFITHWTCSLSPEFGTVPTPAGVDVEANVTFNFPTKFSFRTGVIGAIAVGAPRTFNVASDATDWVTITTFPSQPTTIYWQLNNSAEEHCDVKPPLSQCTVASFGVGQLRVYLKPAPICNLCSDPPPVYGLVTNGRRDGVSSLKAMPF